MDRHRPTAERAGDVVLVTRGDAQADTIDQGQVFALAAWLPPQSARLQRNDFLRKRSATEIFGQFGCHDDR